MSELTKIILLTAHPAETHAFYSVVGISWAGEGAAPSGKRVEPQGFDYGTKETRKQGLPILCGDFGNTEFLFFHQVDPNRDRLVPGILLHFEVEDPPALIEELKRSNLFVPAPEFVRNPILSILDPDGRQVLLCPNYLGW